ncbi:MAG: choice-of-anchor D domain-containing protein, partial [Candidatus Methanomethylicaceae archaeon]
VVVRFSSATPGSFSKSISISSNGGNTTVTVTGIAHKVSFSPAQLDFGSGLLVLREQCNNMGVCGLHKVGLPIEKTLTVKNEGTVAVTLTLSTAAPYEIVSVLPTLSPGQSGQVTVRFDPNESGNFTGTVQVGINGGQGSVTSPPLVGMAHKIEIDPAELDFGLVIIGSMMEQKLMIKNHGVTIVTLDIPNTTQNMASPFRIALDSSVTLNPSECKEILVQFDPITLGQFQETISLLIGQTLLSFLVRARVVTPEEFLRIVGTLFIPGNPNLFFDGFAGLEVSLTDFQSLARNLLVGQTQLPSPENLEISQALEELKLWLNNPAFEQKIQELMQRYPAFGAFVNQIQNQLLSLGLSQNYVQVLHIFISLIAEGESSLSNIIWLTSQDDVIRRIAQALAAIVAAAKAHPELQNLVLTLFPLGIQTPIDVGTGFALMVTLGLIPALKTGCPNVDICFENLARRLEQVAATTNNPIAFYNNFKGLLMEVTVAFNISILHGWRLLNFSENYTGVTEIDIIAEKFIPGVGTVVAFIEVKSDKGLSSGDIAKKLINYDNYVKNVGKQKYPGKDPLQTKYVIVFISYEQLSARVVEAALTEFQQDGGTTPTLIIYCASGCNGFGQGVFAFDYANIDGLDAAAIMDNLGFIQIAEGLYKIRDPLAFRLHLAFCLESAAIALTEEKRFQYFCECMRWFYPDPQSPNDVIITRH